MGNSSLGEWDLTNIVTNDEKICTHLKDLFKKWVGEYDQVEVTPDVSPVPTAEEQAMIDMLNNLGVNGTTLGNHEFDYSYENLQKQMKNNLL